MQYGCQQNLLHLDKDTQARLEYLCSESTVKKETVGASAASKHSSKPPNGGFFDGTPL